MSTVLLHDKTTIEAFLRRDPYLHLYALGDLDDFFWPYTCWFASQNQGEVEQLFLLYTGGGLPVILAIAGPEGFEALRGLLSDSLRLLPRRFYAHLSPGLAETVRADGYRLEAHGLYLKMGLTDPARLDDAAVDGVEAFGPSDAAELVNFYDRAYPGNWFDPRMLETGCYFGARRDGQIASAAGIHVYSPAYRAAALGNITTLPAYRGLGLGTRVTARLCQSLRASCDFIGLNVKADNAAALKVYTRLGFTPVAEYEEYLIEAG